MKIFAEMFLFHFKSRKLLFCWRYRRLYFWATGSSSSLLQTHISL